jgi:hypothetical protein
MKKQKKARNNPVPTIDVRCRFHPGRGFSQTHEPLGGCCRQNSIEDGLQVPLCIDCHNEVTFNPKGEKALQLKREMQMKYEETHTREEYLRRYMKSYL